MLNNSHHHHRHSTNKNSSTSNINSGSSSGNGSTTFSLKQSIKKLQEIIQPSSHHDPTSTSTTTSDTINTTNNDDEEELIIKQVYTHLENIKLIIIKKFIPTNNDNGGDNDQQHVEQQQLTTSSNTIIGSSTTSNTINNNNNRYHNSILKTSKQMMNISEICINVYKWIRTKRLKLIKQALSHDDDENRYLVLIVENLDIIMTHVLRQFISRKERKMGKSDSGKKQQIYQKIQKDASGNGIILELFVFSLAIACLDVKELFSIEHLSQSMQLKLQQQFWNVNTTNTNTNNGGANTVHSNQRDDISNLGGVFLCAIIDKNIGPHHLLWNEFMESIRLALQFMEEIPGREKLLKSLYNIQLSSSKNSNHLVNVYNWVTITTVLNCQHSKHLPKEICNYLLNYETLEQDAFDCKYITTKFILKELKIIHAQSKDRPNIASLHIPAHEVSIGLVTFLDDLLNGVGDPNCHHYEKLRKTCSEEVIFLNCLLIKFHMLRRRYGKGGGGVELYQLIQKLDMTQCLFETILEYLVVQDNSFKSSYENSMIRDLLFSMSSHEGSVTFDPIAKEMIQMAEDLVGKGKSCLNTNLDGLTLWVNSFLDILLKYPLSSMYPFILRRCFSSMLCRLSNSPTIKYPKSGLLEIVGQYHHLYFPSKCFVRKSNNADVHKCLVTMLRFSAFVFLRIQPNPGDYLTNFYVDAANEYRERAEAFSCKFAFLDSLYVDSTDNDSYKVFAIEQEVLLRRGNIMLSCQIIGSLTDLIFIFDDSEVAEVESSKK